MLILSSVSKHFITVFLEIEETVLKTVCPLKTNLENLFHMFITSCRDKFYRFFFSLKLQKCFEYFEKTLV